MVQSFMTDAPVKPPWVPDASRQVRFHQFLVLARKHRLVDALGEALRTVDPITLKTQLVEYIPEDVQRILAVAGVRDEHVFPTPVVLEASPTLVGYYRLLLGVPQKTFYAGVTGMGRFKSMEKRVEKRSQLTDSQRQALPDFCAAMSLGLADLIRQLSPSVTQRDLAEIPILTLGSQLQGANNNDIGRTAVLEVFLAVAELVEPYLMRRSDQQLILRNGAGRQITITLASDPDVRIQEEVGNGVAQRVAIEVKGGTDRSNAHNRAGEAEKSHLKAKRDGFRNFWTLIAKKGLDMTRLREESPTTTDWFDVAQILGREGADWDWFRTQLATEAGIPLTGPDSE